MNRTITAYFDSRADAQSAADRLREAGVLASDIDVHDSSAAGATGATTDEDKGFWASLADLFMPDEDRYSYSEGIRRGGSVLSVRADGDFERVSDILEDAGAVDMDTREAEWRSEGWSGYDSSTMDTSTGVLGTREDTGSAYRGMSGTERAAGDYGAGATAREDYIPVAEEQLRIGKRDVDHGRVRVRSYVRETPVEEQVRLRDETVEIERNPVDRAAAPADDLFEDRVIEAEEHYEEAVVSKEARVTEEVRLRKDVQERDETIRDTVRRTDVEVEDDRTDTNLTDEERARRGRGY